jgi:transcriptional regulator with XRE-family HTH domain
METPMTFAQWLKRTRREKGLTQRVLNEKAGLGKNYVTALEGGSIELPTKATRQALHFVLGTSDQELMNLGLLEVDPYTGEDRAPRRQPAAIQPTGNPFDLTDPRYAVVEALKRIDLTGPRGSYLAGYLAQMTDVLRANSIGYEQKELGTSVHVPTVDETRQGVG